MSFDMDDEIVQDFLVEAGEILEGLGEQLVELENSPQDNDLLNAVFRAFHTIKGGASFINLTNLVEVCHVAEDVFNLLRNGEKEVDANLMDVMLQVLDVLNEMFDEVRAGEEPTAADPALIQALRALLDPNAAPAEAVAPEAAPEAEPAAEAAPASEAAAEAEPATEAEATPGEAETEAPTAAIAPGGEDITDEEFEQLLDALDGDEAEAPGAAPAETAEDEITEDEFEQLLDELHGEGQFKSPAAAPQTEVASAAPASDEITEEEFEQLLDDLHGKGQFKSPDAGAAPEQEAEVKTPAAPAAPAGDEITEEEFENLLDDLHGKGQFNNSVGQSGDAAPAAAKESAPESTAEEPPVAAQAEEAKTAEAPAAQAAAEAPAAEKAVESPAATPKAAPAKEAAGDKKAAKGAGDKKAAPEGETTVRVDTKRLDDIMNMVGELVLVRNRLVNLEANMHNEEMTHAISNLDLVTADLQASVMKTRMQPIKKVFGRFPRVVRDLARSLKKEVKLELRGEETDLDKNLVEALADPLVHLVRNAVDHGIEDPETRDKTGKSRQGTVILAAEQEGDHILLTITDDGAGMNAGVLRRKAVEKGILDEESASRLDDKDAYNLIFAPGFSTKTEISDVSGRGVGMDVVKTRIVQLNGSVEIDSVEGQGSRIIIKVPLTLAIMPTLMVMLGTQTFALPLVSVSEIFNLDLTNTNVVHGQLVIMLRDRPLPLYFLKDWLVKGGMGQERPKEGHVVVVSFGNQRVGFVVEHLIGQEEVVIKPLGAMLQGTKGLAGATITGDGRIALILDVPSLVSAYSR